MTTDISACNASAAHSTRKVISLPVPTYNLVRRIASDRRMNMSELIYVMLQDQIERDDTDEDWQFAPQPFTIRPTYLEDRCVVLFANPHLATLKLSRVEAEDLAAALQTAKRAGCGPIELTCEGRQVTVARRGTGVSLRIGDVAYPMPVVIASSVAKALVSAALHAGPLPMGGPA